MANLGNLIVRGVTRILGDAYANKFIGNLQGNADTATSAIKASTADSATSATSANKALIATAVQDYGTSDYREIKIGYNGSGLSSSTITHAVGFTDGGTKIKDISKDEFRNWLATASGTWNISILGNAATATNAENISSIYPQLAASLEADEINVKRKIDWNNWGDYGYQLETAIDFNWYETHNLFGVIRGSSADSAGFGWMYSPDGSTYTPIARLSPSGHAKVNSLKTQYICIECDNSGNTAGRSSEINNYAGPLYIQYNTSNDCFICSGGGNVGIGTVSPSSKLHVVGDIYTTTGFKKEGSSDSYVLLGGGGHKLISDFSIAHSHPYLPLSGGTLTGSVMMRGIDTNLIRDIVYDGTSGWARDLIALQVDGVRKFAISAFGEYTAGASDNGIYYGYIGCNYYDGLNLRISDTSLTWEDNPILHSGNYNSYTPSLTGAGASGTWNIHITGGLTIQSIYSETDINSNYLKVYAGVGDTWTGEIGSMAYSAILGIGDPSRGFQLWAQRGDGTMGCLHYRVGTFDAHSWNTERTLIDNETYNLYSPKLDGTGATGTWGINISGNAATATDADTLDGYHAQVGHNKPWGMIPVITESGYMDVGRHFEFHYDNTTGSDYSTILRCTGNYSNIIDLPSTSGTLALTTDNVASASKWATPRTISLTGSVTGSVSIDGSQNVSLATTTNHTHTFDSLNSKPNTIIGYGIVDSIRLVNDSSDLYVGARSNYGENMTGSKYLEWWNSAGWVHHKAGKFSVYGGTSSQFLKADGSLDSTAYLTEQNLQGYATQEWVRGEEYLYRSGGTMDARAEIGITTKLFIGNSTSPDTCYTKFNCILHGGGDESNPNWIIHDNGYSEFKSSVSANAFYASSDIRLKNILDDINIDFDKLKLIPKKYYTWKGSDILQLGTIAQDIQKIYPEVVSKNENGYLSVDYSKLSIIALAAIDKLNERIKELECQIKL